MRIYKRGMGILCAVILLALTGCQMHSGRDTGDTGSEAGHLDAGKRTEDDTTADGTTQATAGQETTEPIRLRIVHHNSEDFAFYGGYDTIELPDMNPDMPIVKAMREWSAAYEQDYMAQMADYINELSDEENLQPDVYYYLNKQIETQRVDSQVVSLSLFQSAFRGGVHGDYWTEGVSFDSQTGEQLTLEDLGDIKDDMKDAVWNRLKDEEYGFFDNPEATIEEMIQMESVCWYLTGGGIQVIFNPYELAPYASGDIRVLIPYEELEGMNAAYIPSGNEIEYQMLQEGSHYEEDIDGDGETELLSVMVNYGSEGEDTAVTVACNTSELILTDTVGMDSAYVCKAEGVYYLLVTTYGYGEYRTTRMYEFADDEPIEIFRQEGAEVLGYSQDGVWMLERIERLGTYFGYRYYRMQNGNLQRESDVYVLTNTKDAQYRCGITPNMGIPVLFRQEMDGELQEGVLEAGTKIYPTIIYDYPESGASTIGFELEDGTYGELQVQIIDGMQYVNEIEQSDMFDDLPYFG